MKTNITATVCIPTYNGEDYIGEILKMLGKQTASFNFETFIIDSGSKDATLDIVRKYMSKDDRIRLHEIPNTEFGHGKTRNLAAKMSNGEFVVYLSHDAVPAHKDWLAEMVRPFSINEKVVAVLGKQDPRPTCFPLMKYDIKHVFSAFGSDQGVTLFSKDTIYTSQGDRDILTFYSDVNSATRREFLLNKIPYQDVSYSEDQIFGKEVIEAGYYKAYSPAGNVTHSNDMLLKEYKKRMFDETVGLRIAGHDVPRWARHYAIQLALKGALADSIRILRDGQYSRKRKIYWLAVNPLFHIEKWRGIYSGSRVDINNPIELEKMSLESARKTK